MRKKAILIFCGLVLASALGYLGLSLVPEKQDAEPESDYGTMTEVTPTPKPINEEIGESAYIEDSTVGVGDTDEIISEIHTPDVEIREMPDELLEFMGGSDEALREFANKQISELNRFLKFTPDYVTVESYSIDESGKFCTISLALPNYSDNIKTKYFTVANKCYTVD